MKDVDTHEIMLYKSVAEYVPQNGGLKLEAQQQRMRLFTALNECSDRSFGKKASELKTETLDVSLEDADVEILKDLVKKVDWYLVDEQIVIFGKKVEDL